MNTSWLDEPQPLPDLLRDLRNSTAVKRIMRDLPGWEVDLYDDRYPAMGSIERIYTWKLTCPAEGPYGPPVIRVIPVPVTTAVHRHSTTSRVGIELLEKLEDAVETLSRELSGYGWETYKGILLPPNMIQQRRREEQVRTEFVAQAVMNEFLRASQVWDRLPVRRVSLPQLPKPVWRRWSSLPLPSEESQRPVPQTREDRFVEHLEEYARGYHHP